MISTTIYVVLSVLIALFVPSVTSKFGNQRISKSISSFFEKQHSDIIKA